MVALSAFADEIAADLNEQIAVLQDCHIRLIDLRSAWGINVLMLSDEQITEIQQILRHQNMAVAAIGSPIGKVPVDAPFESHLSHFDRVLQIAQRLGAPSIRLFSFYPPQQLRDDWHTLYREEILQRLREMTARARAAGVMLLHENEKEIYGDTIARCVDLMQGVNDPSFRFVFDPANFLQCEQVPYPDAYQALCPWLHAVHIKDVTADGTLVPVGEGEAQWPALLRKLREDGYDGVLSLEPHLSAAGQFQGFSGPDLFRRAAHALQALLEEMHW